MKKLMLGPFALMVLLASVAWAGADDPNLGLRLSGGYGFSLNSQTDPLATYPESPGIPTGAELLYFATDHVQLSLGVFPVFMNRTYAANFFNLSTSQVVQGQETDSATFMPVIMSIYIEQPLGGVFSLFESVGFGVVPATSVSRSNDQGVVETPQSLDAGFALRGSLGLAAAINRNFRLGIEVQELDFNQSILSPLAGWYGQTADFNQVAPMLFAEARI